MCYTHIWSNGHVLYPYMVICPPLQVALTSPLAGTVGGFVVQITTVGEALI